MIAAEVYKHPYRICNPDGDLQFIILCDHATNAIPPGYHNLGLTDDQLAQHIAWDIGAAKTAEMIGDRLDCPVILAGFSRLLIDANRGIDDPTLVMQLSDGEVIEGNLDIHPARQCAEKKTRISGFYEPYHAQIEHYLQQAEAAGKVPIILSVHSFTPFWKEQKRPMPAAILWDKDDRLPRHIEQKILAFQAQADARFQGPVAHNDPYSGQLKYDTLYRHGTANGLPHALIELRQDLVTQAQDCQQWAQIMVAALQAAAVDSACQSRHYYGSVCDAPNEQP